MASNSLTGKEKIIVTPQTALSDAVVRIKLTGFQPNTQIKLLAEMTDDLHTVWGSHAVFTADKNGEVDVAAQKPDSGTYDDVDAMGLFWSMVPQDVKDLKSFTRNKYSFYIKHEINIPTIIAFKAFVDDYEVAASFLERIYLAPDVTAQTVREKDLVGTYYTPAGGTFRTALLLIGGLDGLEMETEAALLASHGYAVFTLKYFGEEKELPDYVGYIPIEYFKKGIDWLLNKTGRNKIGLVGRSKGAEVALMVASMFPEHFGVVVSNMPSSIALFGIKSLNSLPFPPAWTYKGKSIPHLQMRATWYEWLDMKVKLMTGQRFTFADYYLKEIQNNQESFKQAVIRVEKIQCPIFIISAADDHIWPTSFYCDEITKRLKEHNFKYAYEHLDCKNAGHYVCNPNWPAGLSNYWKTPGFKLAGIAGGDAKHNAHAARDYWQQTLKFLENHFNE